MNRHWWVACVAVVALCGGLASCGGGDDEPKTKVTTSTPSATPTIPPQPKGEDGVTYEIQNWDTYADDPAVLAWKQTLEAISASSNQGKILKGARDGMSKKVLRQYLPAVRAAWDRDWHVLPLSKVKVLGAETTGNKARLTGCLWAPSTGFYEKNGKFFGKPEVFWLKQRVKMTKRSGAWVLDTVTFDGKCKGGKPA